MKNQAGGAPMAWLNPSWIGNGSGLHLWYAEAPAGTWWDLTQASALRLPVYSSAVAGMNLTSNLWDMPGRFENAIIQLCGDNDTLFQRYTPTLPARRFRTLTQTVRVPLRPVTADGWSASNPSFDFSRVRRIEVLLSPETTINVTFTNRFLTDAGLIGFESL